MAIVFALHHAVAPGLAGHPERVIVAFFIRVRLLPLCQGRRCLGLKLLPRGHLNMLSGIYPETVDAILAYPLA